MLRNPKNFVSTRMISFERRHRLSEKKKLSPTKDRNLISALWGHHRQQLRLDQLRSHRLPGDQQRPHDHASECPERHLFPVLRRIPDQPQPPIKSSAGTVENPKPQTLPLQKPYRLALAIQREGLPSCSSVSPTARRRRCSSTGKKKKNRFQCDDDDGVERVERCWSLLRRRVGSR